MILVISSEYYSSARKIEDSLNDISLFSECGMKKALQIR